MWRATVKALFAQRVRLVMTVLAIALGVAFVAGTLVLTDTMARAFDDLFRTVNKGIAVEVTKVGTFEEGRPPRSLGGEPVPESLVGAVRGVEGVRAAEGRRAGYAQLLREGAASQGGPGGASFGVGWASDPDLNQLVLHAGREPRKEGEVVLVQPPARDDRLQVGDRARVLLQTGAVEAEVVGLAGFGASANPGLTLIAFDPATAARVLGPDSVIAVEVAAEPGVAPDELRERIEQILPAGFRALTGGQAAEALSSQVRRRLSFINTALLVFAGIAIFVGAFIIYNTFQILVAQRTRELGLLRALGATPRQVRRSVTGEAVIVGLAASVVGVAGGVLLSLGIRAVVRLFGVDLPGSGIVLRPRTAVVAVAVGVGMTTLSSIVPAVGASRIPPIAALRDGLPATWRASRDRMIAGGSMLSLGTGLLLLGLFGEFEAGIVLVGAGAAVTFLGVAVLAPVLVRPAARALGGPLPRLAGVPGKLGRENAIRNPKRTASTAAALMVGLGLVACVGIVGQSVKASAARAVEGSVKADYIISPSGFGGFGPEVAERLRDSRAFADVVEFQRGPVGLEGRARRMDGVDPLALGRVLRVDMVSGSLAGLGDGEVLVAQDTATERGWKVGDAVPLVFARTGEQRLRLAGIFSEGDVLDSFVVTPATYRENFTAQEQLDALVLVTVDPGTPRASVRRAADRVARAFPVVRVQDQEAFARSQASRVDRVLGIVTALLGLSIVVALFGIANTLGLSVFERTREIGLLRAVGMVPRQVRAMVRWESVIVAVLGALLGTAVGAFFGWAIVEALSSSGVSVLSAPVRELGAWILLSGVLGVAAAVVPARRAARLDVLRAISYE